MSQDQDWVDDPTFKKSDNADWVDDPHFNKNNEPGIINSIKDVGERVARGALRTLPTVGAMGGSLIGGIAGGTAGSIIPFAGTASGAATGGVIGAGLGAGAGKTLQNIGEHLLGDDKTRDQIYIEPLNDIKNGMMWEMGGQSAANLIGRGIDAVGNKIKDAVSQKYLPNVDYTPIENKDEILKASEALNLKPPKALLTNNPTYQKLESGLSQSGSFPASKVRNQYNDFFDGVKKASEKIADLKSPESDFALGKSLQEDLTNQVNASRSPVTEMYNDISPDLQNIEVNKNVVNKVFGNLKKDPIFQTKDGVEFLNEHKNIVSQAPELNSLKEYRSGLNDLLNQNSLPIESKRVEALRNAVTSIRNNSIEAFKAELPKSQYGVIDDLLNKISLADSAHASNLSDINSIKNIVGNKDFSSPTTFLNKLGDAKEADIAQKASGLDISSLQKLKDIYPSVFEKAKTAKINDMIQQSTNPISGFNEARFFKQYDNLDQELKDLLFTPEIQSNVQNLKTIKQSIPEKLGPSGTPSGQMMMDMFSPRRNMLDYGIKKALGGIEETSIPKVATPLEKPTNILQFIPRSVIKDQPTKLFDQNPISFPDAADKNNGQDGAMNFNSLKNKEALLQKTQGTKFYPIIKNAVSSGPQSLAAAQFMLMKDPEYQRLINN